MRIKVSYRTIVEEVIEVDDKFYKMTDSGGWDDLAFDERHELISELMSEVCDKTEAGYSDNVVYIEEDGTEEIMYDG